MNRRFPNRQSLLRNEQDNNEGLPTYDEATKNDLPTYNEVMGIKPTPAPVRPAPRPEPVQERRSILISVPQPMQNLNRSKLSTIDEPRNGLYNNKTSNTKFAKKTVIPSAPPAPYIDGSRLNTTDYARRNRLAGLDEDSRALEMKDRVEDLLKKVGYKSKSRKETEV